MLARSVVVIAIIAVFAGALDNFGGIFSEHLREVRDSDATWRKLSLEEG